MPRGTLLTLVAIAIQMFIKKILEFAIVYSFKLNDWPSTFVLCLFVALIENSFSANGH